jgi:hypothetical protein
MLKDYNMFACKKFDTPQGLMLAACDSNILGKKLKFNDVEIEIHKDFYFEKFCSEEELINIIKEAKIINLFGNKIMKVVISLGLARKEEFKIIDGIAHIQIYRL